MGLAKVRSADKFIPPSLLTASPEHRLALLQGLLDTDGCPDPRKSTIEYCSVSSSLVEGVADLVRGLGGKATVSGPRTTRHQGGDGQPSWRVHLSLPVELSPFRLPRKLTNRVAASKYRPLKTIVSVVEEGVTERQVCIVVDAPDSLYVTRGHTLTHNSFCAAAGAKHLFATDQIDLVVACTVSKSKIDLCRFFQGAGLDAVIPDGDKSKRRKTWAKGHQVYILNYEKLWVDYQDIVDNTHGLRVLFIFDECQRIVAESVETRNKARQAFERLSRMTRPLVWPMSASVVNGNPQRFRDVFDLCPTGDNPLGTPGQFEGRYADEVRIVPKKTPRGRWFTLRYPDWNLSKLTEVRHRVGDCTQVVRKTDPGVREYFKGIATIVVPITPSKAERELMNAIVDRAWEAFRREEGLNPYYNLLRYVCNTPAALAATDWDIAADILADFRGDITKIESTKLGVLNEKLDSIRESGDQALVFTHFTNLGLHLIADQIEVPHVIHYGVGQSNKESQRVKDEFKANPDITCFLTSDAGKEGMSMQNARYVIQYDPLYSYDDTMQRASRIDRADSHLDGLTNFVMVTEDSVEERLWEINHARRKLSAAVQGSREELSHGERERARRSEAENASWLIFGDRG